FAGARNLPSPCFAPRSQPRLSCPQRLVTGWPETLVASKGGGHWRLLSQPRCGGNRGAGLRQHGCGHQLAALQMWQAPDLLGSRLLVRRKVPRRVVMRARYVKAGLRRIGIVLALILSLPLIFALWTWITLGRTPPAYVYLFLAAGLGAYLVATSIGWIAAAFPGEDESQSL